MFRKVRLLSIPRVQPLPAPEDHCTDRKHEDYLVKVEDMVALSRCAARWVFGIQELPARGYRIEDLIADCFMALLGVTTRIVEEPEDYEARVLVCPSCDSVGAGKTCTKCSVARKLQVVRKPWAARAKECLRWTEQAQLQGAVPIKHAHLVDARGAAASLWNDPDIAAFARNCQLQKVLVGQWHETERAQPIWVSQRIDVLPCEGHPLDQALALLYLSADAGHGRHSDIAHHRYHHMQAALALDLANACCDGRFREVLQMIVEPTAPYLVARRRLSAGFINEGRRLYTESLTCLTECRRNNEYPTLDPSAPSQLDGWTKVEHDPMQHEGSDKTDARFSIEQTITRQAGKDKPRAAKKRKA
jgi:hypothetical protein